MSAALFRNDRPIFAQIATALEDEILAGRLAPEGRVPAVRDHAAFLGVNPNTVARAFDLLEAAGVLEKRRGLGSYVSSNARALILARRRRAFLEEELPALARTMHLLGIDPDTVARAYVDAAAAQGKAP
jgi:GntR family transcriptional regulator